MKQLIFILLLVPPCTFFTRAISPVETELGGRKSTDGATTNPHIHCYLYSPRLHDVVQGDLSVDLAWASTLDQCELSIYTKHDSNLIGKMSLVGRKEDNRMHDRFTLGLGFVAGASLELSFSNAEHGGLNTLDLKKVQVHSG